MVTSVSLPFWMPTVTGLAGLTTPWADVVITTGRAGALEGPDSGAGRGGGGRGGRARERVVARCRRIPPVAAGAAAGACGQREQQGRSPDHASEPPSTPRQPTTSRAHPLHLALRT